MINKEYQTGGGSPGNLDLLQAVAVSIRILVGAVLLYVGISLTFWAVRIVDKMLNSPDSVPLIQALIESSGTSESVRFTNDGNSFIIENTDMLQWFIFFFVILILFNVIGRAIATVFKCALQMFTSLDIQGIKKKGASGKS